jgi:hypothetical protein
MLMPIAFQLARRTNISPSSLLMPMWFGALLGGTITLVGTSPNIIISRLREQILGQPFNMFDVTPVGARALPHFRLAPFAPQPQGCRLHGRRLRRMACGDVAID